MRSLTRTFDVLLTILAVAVLAALAPDPNPMTAVAATTDGCGNIAAYQRALADTIPTAENATEERVVTQWLAGTLDFEHLRPSQALAFASYLDRWATALEEIPSHKVPAAATAHHDALIDLMSVMTVALQSYASGGVFAMLPYAEAIEAATDDLDRADRQAQRRCGAQWTRVFGTSDGYGL